MNNSLSTAAAASPLGRVPQQFSLINPATLTPVRILTMMCLAWAAILWAAPISMRASTSNGPYFLLAGCLGCLFLGLVIFEPKFRPVLPMDADDLHRRLLTFYRIAFILGVLGVILRLADWVFLRGLSVDTEFMQNREKIETAGANIFSMASTILIPFTVAPYMFYAVAKRNGLRVGRTLTSLGLAIVWPLLTVIIGSRSSMFMSVGMIVLARIVIFPRTSKILMWAIFLLFVGLIYAGGLIFIARLTEIGLKVEGVIRLSAFTNFVPVTNEYYSIISSMPEWQRDSVFIATTFCQYFLHGVPEFVYLVEHYNNGEQWGAYGFSFFPRLLSSLWGVKYDANAVLFSVPRVGVYTTMFGPFYVDFGPLAPVFCFILGGFISFTRSRVLNGDVAALPLYIVFLIQIAAAVVINAFLAAYGIFFDLAFLSFWLVAVLTRRRTTSTTQLRIQEARQ